MRATRYTVITAADCQELARNVETALQDGWHPQGGIASYIVEQYANPGYSDVRSTESWFMQAMVRM